MTCGGPVELFLPDPDDTTAAARRLAPALRAGDCVLLSGSIGAGKTHFARAVIQTRLLNAGVWDDVPSPTFTLVQTYTAGETEIWHADLYRLTDSADLDELGLEDALSSAIVLIEWPDRMAGVRPSDALELHLAVDGSGRRLNANGPARLTDPLGSVA